jgi:hypothetical protein
MEIAVTTHLRATTATIAKTIAKIPLGMGRIMAMKAKITAMKAKMFLVFHMMTVVKTLHFAMMVRARRVISVKTAGTELTEHVAHADKLHQETHVVSLQARNHLLVVKDMYS